MFHAGRLQAFPRDGETPPLHRCEAEYVAPGRCRRLAPAPYKDGRADSAQDAKDGEEEAVGFKFDV